MNIHSRARSNDSRLSVRLIFYLLVSLTFSGCRQVMVHHIPWSGTDSTIKEAYDPGLYYTLPKTNFDLEVHCEVARTYRGKFADFSHLINYPLDSPAPPVQDHLLIKKVKLHPLPVPDPAKTFRINAEAPDLPFFQKKFNTSASKYHKLKINYGTLENRSINIQMAKNRIILPYTSVTMKKARQKQKKRHQWSRSIEVELQKLFVKNDLLLDKLDQYMQEQDTLTGADSLLRAEIFKIKAEIMNYEKRIKELKTLFKTYKGEDIARSARKYSQVIHKLVELKTSLAGGQTEIDYNQVEVRVLLEDLDKTLDHYLALFQHHTLKNETVLHVKIKPTRNQLKFTYGLFRSSEQGFYLIPYEGQKDHLALLQFTFQPEGNHLPKPDSIPYKITTRKRPGFYYNVSVYAQLEGKIIWEKEQSPFPLLTATVPLPQLGTVKFLPGIFNTGDLTLDPVTGGLRKTGD